MKDKVFNIYGQMTFNEISDNKNCLIIPSSDTKKAETKFVPVEDVEPTEVVNNWFQYIITEGKTPKMIRDIDNDIRAAARDSTASDLVRLLAYHQSMGNINVVYVSNKKLYDSLNEHYGLPYNYTNFGRVRSLNPIIRKRR